jgi:hypothetical protein
MQNIKNCHKKIYDSSKLEARKLVSGAIIILPQQVWITWCESTDLFCVQHKLKTVGKKN